jgi:hypothetical protein
MCFVIKTETGLSIFFFSKTVRICAWFVFVPPPFFFAGGQHRLLITLITLSSTNLPRAASKPVKIPISHLEIYKA